MIKFLLDTDVCSAHMRRPASLAHRFIQFTGQLAVPTIVLAELYAGAYKHPQASRLLRLIADLVEETLLLDFDAACAEQFGRTRGGLLQQGISVPTIDLMIASAAIVHDLTLVTHNSADFRNIPNLRMVDWLRP
jgi:tRNA(fMet)-specific endonuclease VapC